MAVDPVVAVERFAKEYRTGLALRSVVAVREASFEVRRGEVFGFVGPNGAGKTTTIRAILGLIRPTAGSVALFGMPPGKRSARQQVGFLPESPTFYDYLTARELLDLAGRLFGLDAPTRRRRTDELLARVGLAAAADRPIRKYSKGMLQRVGLAQALVNDPELVVLDEPMSGLDPVGRKDVRDLLLALRDAGKTVFFSTHILPDVEAVCDRVAILVGGRIHDVGPVGQLLSGTLVATDVVLRLAGADVPLGLVPAGATARRVDEELTVMLPPATDLEAFLGAACRVARVVSVTPRRETLEDLFMRRTAAGRAVEHQA